MPGATGEKQALPPLSGLCLLQVPAPSCLDSWALGTSLRPSILAGASRLSPGDSGPLRPSFLQHLDY